MLGAKYKIQAKIQAKIYKLLLVRVSVRVSEQVDYGGDSMQTVEVAWHCRLRAQES